ncbi:MAG: MFS transporter [Aquiluna sp.]
MSEPQAEKKTPFLKLQLLSMAAGLSYMGSSLTTFAVILRDKDAVGPAGVSIILLAMLVPNVLMAPFSGQIADRFPSRRVVPLALSAMAVSTLSIALMPLAWWAPIALFTTATFGTLVGASSAATVGSVSNPEDMTRVTGIQQTYVSLGSLLGPAAGGILVGTTGYFWPFVIDAASFVILTIVFLALGLNRLPTEHLEEDKPRALDGFRFLRDEPLLRAIVLLLLVVIVALGVISVGEVFLVVDELGASEIIYGFIGALFAAGSLLGALTLQLVRIPDEKQPLGLVFSIGLMVVSLSVLSQIQHWGYATVIYFLAGLGSAGVNVFAVGQIQRRAKESIRGRIMAAVQGSVTAGNALSLGLGGILIGIFGVREVFLAGGITALLALVIFGPKLVRAGRPKVQ